MQGGDCGRSAVVLPRFVGSRGDQAGPQRVQPVGTSHDDGASGYMAGGTGTPAGRLLPNSVRASVSSAVRGGRAVFALFAAATPTCPDLGRHRGGGRCASAGGRATRRR